MTIVNRGVIGSRAAPTAPPPRVHWPLTVATIIGFGIAISNLSPLVQGVWWWFVSMAVVLVVVAATTAARFMFSSRWIAPLVGILALLFTLCLFFASSTSLLGIIPTGDTIAVFEQYAEDGMASIAAQSTPAVVTPSILVLIASGVGAVAIVVDVLVFGLRLPAASGLIFLALVIVPTFIDPSLGDVVLFLLTAAAWLAIVYVSSPRSRPRDAIIAGAVSVVAAIIVQGVALPITQSLQRPNVDLGYSTGLNPLLTLGDNLRRTSTQPALRYATDSDVPLYFTVSILDDFSENGWEPAPLQNNSARNLDRIPAPRDRAPEVATAVATTQVQVQSVGGKWLPVPFAPTAVTGLEGDWRAQTTNQAIRTRDSTIRGQKYEVTSSFAVPSSQQLRESGTNPALGLEASLALPDGMPDILYDRALSVTQDASTNYDKAIALQSYFRSGEFTYSEETPVNEGFDGTDVEVIATFLDVKSGYCVHYASAMATMARAIGIPARVAVGFVPGKPSTGPDGAKFLITTDELHSWPELHFKDVGWVRFEPTPGRGYVPEYPAKVTDPSAAPSNTPAPSATPKPSSTATAKPSASPADLEKREQAAAAASKANSERQVPLVAGVAVLLLLALLGPAITRFVRRRSRFAAVRKHGDALAAWREIVDSARDVGLLTTESGTPQELQDSLGGPSAMGRLRESAEESAYSRTPAPVAVDDLEESLRFIASKAKPGARVKATFAPPSELERIGQKMSRFAPKQPAESPA